MKKHLFNFAVLSSFAFVGNSVLAHNASSSSLRVREKIAPVCSEIPVAGDGNVIPVDIPSGWIENSQSQYLVSSTFRLKGRLTVEHTCDSVNKAGTCQFAVENNATLRTNYIFNNKIGYGYNSVINLARADGFSGAKIVDDKIQLGKVVKLRQNVRIDSGATFVKTVTTGAALSSLASKFNSGIIRAEIALSPSANIVRNGDSQTGPSFNINDSFEGSIEVCHYYLDYTLPQQFE